jgi:hypothetical protein
MQNSTGESSPNDPSDAPPAGSSAENRHSLLSSELERSPDAVAVAGIALEASPAATCSLFHLPRQSDDDHCLISDAIHRAQDASGLMQVPEALSGTMQMPEALSGAMQMPEDASGAMQMPEDASGVMQMPEDASGAMQMPEDASGAMQIPEALFGAMSMPIDASIGVQEPAPAAAALTDSARERLPGNDEFRSLISHLKFGQIVQKINKISADTANGLECVPGVELQNFGQALRDNAFKFELPRLIIIGDEKSGKSSTVERLAMAPVFPRQEESTMTRQAILLKLRFSEAHAFDRPLYILTIPPCTNSRGGQYVTRLIQRIFVIFCVGTTKTVFVTSSSLRIPAR